MNRLSRRHAEQPRFAVFFMSAQLAAFEARFIFSRHHNIFRLWAVLGYFALKENFL